jgi:Rrf2 family transcriptional regulator, iron-sulfur cluster assembly transcription factor
MTALSRRGRLAIAAVLDIAMHGQRQRVGAREMAERLGLPPRYLEPLMKRLKASYIVLGRRGSRGGYVVRNMAVTCGEIVRAVGPELEDGGDLTSQWLALVVEPAVRRAEELYFRELDSVTVAALCTQAWQTESVKPLTNDEPVSAADAAKHPQRASSTVAACS